MSDTDISMIGAGGGSKAGKYTNKPDNLRSTDSFEILLGLGSGRWKGLVNGLKSLYINDVPMENEDGTSNYEGITALFADGNPLEKQLVNFQLGGGGGITTVNTTLGNLNTSGPGPWVNAATTTPNATFIDFRFVVNQLMQQKKNGVFEATANIEIEMRPVGSGTWINPLQAAVAAPTTYSPTTGSFTYSDTLRDNDGNFETANYRTYMARDDLVSNGSGGYNWTGVVAANTAGTNGKFTITGKTSSPFVKELRIAVPNTGTYASKTWEVRARLTEKAQQYVNANTENQEETNRNILFETVTSITKESFGSADSWRGLVWMQVGGKASDQLNGFPALKGIYDTKIVKVPPATVFNPATRQYTGTLWDGTYALQYTNDPAWCLKDLIEDSVSGIAALSPGATLDKWDALECSKYCSALVSDGKGGTHPRFSMNFRTENQLNTQELINYMAGAFSALAVDTGNGKWRLKMDKPETPVATYTVDNILGDFQYSHTDMDTRFNDITLSFLNADNKYEEDRVRVFDQANINLFGRKPTTIVAVGADSRQEALRRGMLRLRASLNEKKVVKFVTNRQGRLLQPLETILIADQALGYSPPTGSGVLSDTDTSDNRTTSRIVAINAARTEITLGRSIRLEPTVVYQISMTVPNVNYTPDTTTQPTNADWNKPTVTITRQLTNSTFGGQQGDVTVLYFNEALPTNIPPNAVVALSAPGLPSLPVQYRIVEVVPGEEEQTTISAINVDTGKYTAADNVASNEVAAWVQTGATGTLSAPTVPSWGMFTLSSYPNNGVTQRLLTVNWQRPSSLFLEGYKVERRISSDVWVTETPLTNMNYFEITNPSPGVWEFRITAKDRRGAWSAPLEGLVEVPAIGTDQPLSSAGTFASRPTTGLTTGQQYTALNVTPVTTYRWNGTTWDTVATAGAIVGASIYESNGDLLTRNQVVTYDGIAAGIISQGDLALQDTITWTQVDAGGGRPANNATVGAPAGTMVNGVLSETVTSNIAQAQTDISNLVSTYGSTANASTSALNAAISASLAANSLTATNDALAIQYPPSLDPIAKTAWRIDGHTAIDGPEASWPQPYAARTDNNTRLNVYVFPRLGITTVPGRRYRVTNWVWTSATNATIGTYVGGTSIPTWDVNGGSINGSDITIPVGFNGNGNITTLNQWFKVGYEYTVPSSGFTAYHRPILAINSNNGANFNGLVYQTAPVIEDITSEAVAVLYALNASGSATGSANSAIAAAGSAVSASGSASSAASSAILATQFTGGGNLLTNTDFANLQSDGWSFAQSANVTGSGQVNIAGDPWHPVGENVLSMFQTNRSSDDINEYSEWQSNKIAVKELTYCQAHVQAASHRAQVELIIVPYTSAGAQLSAIGTGRITVGSGGLSFNTNGTQTGFTQLLIPTYQLPAGTAQVDIRLRKWNTLVGEINSYAWFARPYFGTARAGQTLANNFSHGTGKAVAENIAASVVTEASVRSTAISAEASARSTLTSSYNATAATVSSNSSAISTLNAQAATFEQKLVAGNPNMLPNSTFEFGFAKWVNTGGMAAYSGPWGNWAGSYGISRTGGSVVFLESHKFDIYGGSQYTLTSDLAITGTGGTPHCYVDMLFFDATGTYNGDGPEATFYANQDFSVLPSRRTTYKTTATAPASSTTAIVRLVLVPNGGTITSVAVRQIKVELGSEATRYTQEASAAYSAGVIADHTGKLQSYMTLTTSAGSATASVKLVSVDNAGVATSSVAIEAQEFVVSNSTGSSRKVAMKISNGNAQFDGDLLIGGRILFTNGLALKLAVQPWMIQVSDGQSITYPNAGYLPTPEFSTIGLAPLGSGETYSLNLESQTNAGATVRLKISTPGTPSSYNDTTSYAGDATIERYINKSGPDSIGNQYTISGGYTTYSNAYYGSEGWQADFHADINVFGYTSAGGWVQTGVLEVDHTEYYATSSNNAPKTYSGTYQTTITGMSGILNVGVGIVGSSSATITSLVYTAPGSAAGVRSATPGGEKCQLTLTY